MMNYSDNNSVRQSLSPEDSSHFLSVLLDLTSATLWHWEVGSQIIFTLSSDQTSENTQVASWEDLLGDEGKLNLAKAIESIKENNNISNFCYSRIHAGNPTEIFFKCQILVAERHADGSPRKIIGVSIPTYRTPERIHQLDPIDKLALADNQNHSPKLKILLVDDDELNLEIAKTTLQQAGFLVVTAENGLIATERFRRGEFDAIVMDIQMPLMDGIAATECIRADELQHSWITSSNWKITPIIGLTADTQECSKEAAIAAGMFEVLVKPITREGLINVLHSAIFASRR